jgi:bacteriocin biosynthesis cyclodehydratase domain-containing protein
VPVLWRGEGETQVGIAVPRVFTGLSEADQHALALMEGPGVSSLSGLSLVGVAAVRELQGANVVSAVPEGEHPVPAVPTPVVAVYGLSAPGVALALCLARAGVDLELCDSSPLVRESRAHYVARRGAATCASAAADVVRREVPGATVRLGEASAGVAVVIGVGACDPAITVPLMATDTPHLLVTCDEQGAWVGPLVVPGASACATCVGLHLTDADPGWPRLAVQLGMSRRPRLTADAVAGVAALASAAVLAYGTKHVSWAMFYRWRVEGSSPPVAHALAAHPDCGCGASTGNAEPATDELAARRARLAPPTGESRLRTW